MYSPSAASSLLLPLIHCCLLPSAASYPLLPPILCCLLSTAASAMHGMVESYLQELKEQLTLLKASQKEAVRERDQVLLMWLCCVGCWFTVCGRSGECCMTCGNKESRQLWQSASIGSDSLYVSSLHAEADCFAKHLISSLRF